MTIDMAILGPVVGLIAWSMLMWLWMYATRIPAILSAKLELDPHAPRGEQMATLPARVRWKADNYTHLMEQPTIFYALVFVHALLGVNQESGEANLYWAWAYVGLRVAHSLIQSLVNKIELRFLVFVLSNVPLFALTYNAAILILNR